MTRRKSVCSKWTLVLLVVIFCPSAYSRPQDTTSPVVISTNIVQTEKSTESPTRNTSQENPEEVKKTEEFQKITTESSSTEIPNSPRDVKTKVPIRESIQLVANQLLDKPSNLSVDTTIVTDIRIPPKIKNQVSHKHKIKTRNEDGPSPQENAHAGVAVPVTIEDLEAENKISDVTNESSTSNEGISTWILLSNPINTDNSTVTTEPTKTEVVAQKKQKPTTPKNKVKRPQNKNSAKRPIIGSTNKSDLVAGGSAINENVYNKIKDTVLTNVQKNKNTSTQRTTTVKSTTAVPSTEASTTKKEITKSPSSTTSVSKNTTKTKKKNKNKQKVSTTEAPVVNESAILPMEPKEEEIELEVSTPPITTKKPKRTSTRKKTKTKKRKTSKPKPEDEETSVTDIKTSNKTKSAKPAKKPIVPTGAITTQIYNYFSREVMPSVGVGVIGLASLVGLASYFLYPFSTPVRRTLELDKKDDLYRNNAEEYANEGNGQAEEEMLGTVLAGMPTHAKNKLNPYAGQTAHINRYPVKKEQDIRYRNVATKYEPKLNVRYPQQKTGIAHAAVYTRPINYSPQYETRHVYTTEGKYNYDKMPSSYTPYPSVEPIYAAPQTGSSGASAYGSDTSSSVVYGIKPSAESDFKPVYPFEGQFYSETTSSPVTYPPTSMYLGSNNENEAPEDKYDENSSDSNEADDNKFVVGNVPKELVDSATPAVVPEHGPRKLRKRRAIAKRSISGSLEEILRLEKESNKDIFISNEIDDAYPVPIRNLAPVMETMSIISDVTTASKTKDVIPIYAVSVNSTTDEKATDEPTSMKIEVIESVSTLPINTNEDEKSTTELDTMNELDVTTKVFKVYEVFPSSNPDASESSPLFNDVTSNVETTTQFKSMMTETTTELKSETTSTVQPSPSPVIEANSSTSKPLTTNIPEVITYPPLNQSGGFFTFLKRLVEFKYRLGLSILQTTSDSLNKYLRSMENTVQKVAQASQK